VNVTLVDWAPLHEDETDPPTYGRGRNGGGGGAGGIAGGAAPSAANGGDDGGGHHLSVSSPFYAPRGALLLARTAVVSAAAAAAATTATAAVTSISTPPGPIDVLGEPGTLLIVYCDRHEEAAGRNLPEPDRSALLARLRALDGTDGVGRVEVLPPLLSSHGPSTCFHPSHEDPYQGALTPCSSRHVVTRPPPTHKQVVVFHVSRGDPEGMGLAAQARLFARAHVVLGPHGCALANLLWCRAGAAAVFLPTVPNFDLIFYHTAAAVGMRHWTVHTAASRYHAAYSPLGAALDDIVGVVREAALAVRGVPPPAVRGVKDEL